MKLTEQEQRVLELVKRLHGNQKRKYINTPYWEHPLEVAEIVSKHVEGLVEIALLHDVLEDTKTTRKELDDELMKIGYSHAERLFILNGVQALTDEYTSEKYPEYNRKERKRMENERLSKFNHVVHSVKYADLISNTSTIVKYDPGFAKTYLREKIDILDLCRRGNINLLIECCATLHNALNELNLSTP